MAAREHPPGSGPNEAMTIVTDYGFGTLSSSLIALPSIEAVGVKPLWRFAAGRPGEVPYASVDL
jgi:hypothetical protein